MTSPTEPDYLTVDAAAARLSISVETLRRRIRSGQIVAWQPGGPGTRLLVPKEALRPAQSAAPPYASAQPIPPTESPRRSGPRARWRRP